MYVYGGRETSFLREYWLAAIVYGHTMGQTVVDRTANIVDTELEQFVPHSWWLGSSKQTTPPACMSVCLYVCMYVRIWWDFLHTYRPYPAVYVGNTTLQNKVSERVCMTSHHIHTPTDSQIRAWAYDAGT